MVRDLSEPQHYRYSLFGRYNGVDSKTFKARVVAINAIHAIELGLSQLKPILPSGYIVALQMEPVE